MQRSSDWKEISQNWTMSQVGPSFHGKKPVWQKNEVISEQSSDVAFYPHACNNCTIRIIYQFQESKGYCNEIGVNSKCSTPTKLAQGNSLSSRILAMTFRKNTFVARCWILSLFFLFEGKLIWFSGYLVFTCLFDSLLKQEKKTA